jgi:hypothetical protein
VGGDADVGYTLASLGCGEGSALLSPPRRTPSSETGLQLNFTLHCVSGERFVLQLLATLGCVIYILCAVCFCGHCTQCPYVFIVQLFDVKSSNSIFIQKNTPLRVCFFVCRFHRRVRGYCNIV